MDTQQQENRPHNEASASLSVSSGSACPWPTDLWPTTVQEAGERLRAALGDETTTAISGALMRHGWIIATITLRDMADDAINSFRIQGKPVPEEVRNILMALSPNAGEKLRHE